MCTPETHTEAKRARDVSLIFRGVQLDADGEPAFAYVDCLHCRSTLAVPVEEKEHFHAR